MSGYLGIKELVKPELTAIEGKMLSAVGICEPLNSKIKSFLSEPSKRIRSVVALLYNKAQGIEISDSQLEILCAVELVHNASLIHDDIIDESSLRRGQKTISTIFGNKLGVIAGDYLLAVAMGKIAQSGRTEIFARTLKQMCIGEINQNFTRFKIGTIEEYIEKSKNKTGYLFDCAIKSLIPPPSAAISQTEAGDFGLNFGIAFQIRDDLLNILHKDPSKPSTDLEEGIYTAPIIYSGSVKNYTDGIEKTRILLNNYVEKAKNDICNFEDNIYTRALNELTESLKDE